MGYALLNKQRDVKSISTNLRLHDPKWLLAGIVYGTGWPRVGELHQGHGHTFLHRMKLKHGDRPWLCTPEWLANGCSSPKIMVYNALWLFCICIDIASIAIEPHFQAANCSPPKPQTPSPMGARRLGKAFGSPQIRGRHLVADRG